MKKNNPWSWSWPVKVTVENDIKNTKLVQEDKGGNVELIEYAPEWRQITEIFFLTVTLTITHQGHDEKWGQNHDIGHRGQWRQCWVYMSIYQGGPRQKQHF